MPCMMYGDQAVAGLMPDMSADWVVENKTVWANFSLAANSSTTIKTADVSKTGYTPMGVVGWSFDGSYGNCLTYSKMTISGNTLTYLIANNGNNAASSVNCVVCILYRKNY